MVDVNLGDIPDNVLDECMKIIAPELVEDPKPAATPQWISTEERLPDAGVFVLTLDEYGHIKDQFMVEFSDGTIVFMSNGMIPKEYVTHWMSMPEPPEEE